MTAVAPVSGGAYDSATPTSGSAKAGRATGATVAPVAAGQADSGSAIAPVAAESSATSGPASTASSEKQPVAASGAAVAASAPGAPGNARGAAASSCGCPGAARASITADATGSTRPKKQSPCTAGTAESAGTACYARCARGPRASDRACAAGPVDETGVATRAAGSA